MEKFSLLCDVMHRLSPAAWKIVTIIARDDLFRYEEQGSALGALRRDLFKVGGIDLGPAVEPEERSDLTVVDPKDPGTRWTRLSLAAICRGIRDPGKRIFKNRGTGLAKSSAVEAIEEAECLGVLKRRRHKSRAGGDLPTSYSIDWNRVEELVEESKRLSFGKKVSFRVKPR
jgi:hypothetical protein